MKIRITKKLDGEIVAESQEYVPKKYAGDDRYVDILKSFAHDSNWKLGEVREYKVAPNVTDGLLDHELIFSAVLPITEHSDSIKVKNHHGTWYVIDKSWYGLKRVYICESEWYGDEAEYLAIDKNGELVAEDLCIDDYTTQLAEMAEWEKMEALEAKQKDGTMTEDEHVELMETQDIVAQREQERLEEMDAKTAIEVEQHRLAYMLNERKHNHLDKIRALYEQDSKTPEQKLQMTQLAEEWVMLYADDYYPEAKSLYTEGKISAVEYMVQANELVHMEQQGETNPWIE